MARKMKPYLRRMLTPEREALLRRRWKTYQDARVIRSEINALPGPQFSAPELWRAAFVLGVKRPHGFASVIKTRQRCAHLRPEAAAVEVNIAIRSAKRSAKAIRKAVKPPPAPKAPKPRIRKPKYSPSLTMGKAPKPGRKPRKRRAPKAVAGATGRQETRLAAGYAAARR